MGAARSRGHLRRVASTCLAATATAPGGETGFRLVVVGRVIGFLIGLNRIDRRDPLLAFAPAGADDMVEFAPPPSWKDGL